MSITTFGVPKIHAVPVDGRYTFERTRAIAAVESWLAAPAASLLVLWGSVGTGKSQAAAIAIGREWDEICTSEPWSPARRRGFPLWLPAPLITRAAPWDEAPKAWESAGLLVLDDLGEEDATDRTRIAVATLINARWGGERRTLITTNLDGEKFAARYGQRTVDRLRQSGVDERGKARWWIKCVGESMRGRVQPTPPPVPPGCEEPAAISETTIADAESVLARMAADIAREKAVDVERRRSELTLAKSPEDDDAS